MIATKKRRLFHRSNRLGPAFFMLLFGVTVLAACAPRTADWTPAESPKKNVVRWAEFHHPVRFAAASAEPDRTEQEALTQFLNRVGRGQGVRISLASSTGVDTRLGLQRETALADFIRDRGFSAWLGPADGKDAAAPNSVRVTVGRYVAKPPTCPDWSKPATGDPANRVTSNFGCATATNLGLMVADPGVLARGTDLGPADAEALAVGINDYRKNEVKEPDSDTPLEISGGGQ